MDFYLSWKREKLFDMLVAPSLSLKSLGIVWRQKWIVLRTISHIISEQTHKIICIVLLSVVVATLFQWNIEVSDRNKLNHSYAVIRAENKQCLRHLQHVALNPSWRRHSLLAIAMAIITVLVSNSSDKVKDVLSTSVMIFLALEISRCYHNWHILCHANCMWIRTEKSCDFLKLIVLKCDAEREKI